MNAGPRPRTVLVVVSAALVTALITFALIRDLAGGGHHVPTVATATVGAAADPVPLGVYREAAPHASSSLVITGLQGGVRGAPAVPPPDAPLVAPSAFGRPVGQYLDYSEAQLKLMTQPIDALEAALAADDRAGAKAAWEAAYARYLHLGAVYLEGPIADLDERIDGSPGGLAGAPPARGSPACTGSSTGCGAAPRPAPCSGMPIS